MEQNLSNAFSILIVGMITVLLILWLVVVIGNLLIRVTNKYWPASQKEGKTGTGIRSISPGTLASIVATVEAVTGGKGKITEIEKQ